MSSSEPIDFTKFVPPKAQEAFDDYEARKKLEGVKIKNGKVEEISKVFRLRDEVSNKLTAGTLAQTEARQLVQTWWNAHRPMRPVFLLLGGTGSGKTVAVAELASQQPFAYLQSHRGARSASAFGHHRDSFEDLIETQRVLIIDEVGFDRDPAREVSFIHEVVDVRKTSQMPTILISNLSAEDFKLRFDSRTVDRLREYGHVKTVKGESLRGKAAEP